MVGGEVYEETAVAFAPLVHRSCDALQGSASWRGLGNAKLIYGELTYLARLKSSGPAADCIDTKLQGNCTREKFRTDSQLCR